MAKNQLVLGWFSQTARFGRGRQVVGLHCICFYCCLHLHITLFVLHSDVHVLALCFSIFVLVAGFFFPSLHLLLPLELQALACKRLGSTPHWPAVHGNTSCLLKISNMQPNKVTLLIEVIGQNKSTICLFPTWTFKRTCACTFPLLGQKLKNRAQTVCSS